jgi:hypothetical protein
MRRKNAAVARTLLHFWKYLCSSPTAKVYAGANMQASRVEAGNFYSTCRLVLELKLLRKVSQKPRFQADSILSDFS